jgi:hypothetical protein
MKSDVSKAEAPQHGKQRRKSVDVAEKVLEKLDDSPNWFDWKLIKCVLTAGGGFMADAYDLFIISLLTKLIGRCYYPDVRFYSPARCFSHDNPVVSYVGTTGTVTHKCGANWKTMETFLNKTYGNGMYTLDNEIDHVPSDMPTNADFALKSVALLGTLVGQLTFGRLGDLVGRKAMHAATMVILIVLSRPDGIVLYMFGKLW